MTLNVDRRLKPSKYAGRPASPKLEAVVDPFKDERARLLVDPDPCVRVCGRLADAYGLTTALIFEKVDEDAWTVWLQEPAHAQLLKRAKRLWLSHLETEVRAIGLGLSTRRGQPMVLKNLLKEARLQVLGKSGEEGSSIAANAFHNLTDAELHERVGEDEEDEDAD